MYHGDIWFSPLTITGIYIWCRGIGDSIVVIDLWEFFLLPALAFELGTSGSLVLHSTTVPWRLLVFTSDNYRYLTLVQRDMWWHCFNWNYESFSWLYWDLNWGPLDLKSYTPPLFHGDIWFSHQTITGIYLWCREICIGVVLIWPVRVFLFDCTEMWIRNLWISNAVLYHCAMLTSSFFLWKFQVFNSGAEWLVVVLF